MQPAKPVRVVECKMLQQSIN